MTGIFQSSLVKIHKDETTRQKRFLPSPRRSIDSARPLIPHTEAEIGSKYTAHSSCRWDSPIPEPTPEPGDGRAIRYDQEANTGVKGKTHSCCTHNKPQSSQLNGHGRTAQKERMLPQTYSEPAWIKTKFSSSLLQVISKGSESHRVKLVNTSSDPKLKVRLHFNSQKLQGCSASSWHFFSWASLSHTTGFSIPFLLRCFPHLWEASPKDMLPEKRKALYCRLSFHSSSSPVLLSSYGSLSFASNSLPAFFFPLKILHSALSRLTCLFIFTALFPISQASSRL